MLGPDAKSLERPLCGRAAQLAKPKQIAKEMFRIGTVKCIWMQFKNGLN